MKKALKIRPTCDKLSFRKAAELLSAILKSTHEMSAKWEQDTDAPASRPTVYFTSDQENQLVGHILEMANCGFGLTIDRNIIELMLNI